MSRTWNRTTASRQRAATRALWYRWRSSSCWKQNSSRWWNSCQSVHYVTSVRSAPTFDRWHSQWRRSRRARYRREAAWTALEAEGRASSPERVDTHAARTSSSVLAAGAPVIASQTSTLRGTRRANTVRRSEPTSFRSTRWKKPTLSTISSRVIQVEIKCHRHRTIPVTF